MNQPNAVLAETLARLEREGRIGGDWKIEIGTDGDRRLSCSVTVTVRRRLVFQTSCGGDTLETARETAMTDLAGDLADTVDALEPGRDSPCLPVPGTGKEVG